jgi:hypothetical protein
VAPLTKITLICGVGFAVLISFTSCYPQQRMEEIVARLPRDMLPEGTELLYREGGYRLESVRNRIMVPTLLKGREQYPPIEPANRSIRGRTRRPMGHPNPLQPANGNFLPRRTACQHMLPVVADQGHNLRTPETDYILPESGAERHERLRGFSERLAP